jgi:hypothetical protein
VTLALSDPWSEGETFMSTTPVLDIAPEAVQRWHALRARRARMAAGRCDCGCRCRSMSSPRAEQTAFEQIGTPVRPVV